MIDSHPYAGLIKTRDSALGQITSAQRLAAQAAEKASTPSFGQMLNDVIKTSQTVAEPVTGFGADTQSDFKGVIADLVSPSAVSGTGASQPEVNQSEPGQPTGPAQPGGGTETQTQTQTQTAKPDNRGFEFKGIREGMTASVNSHGLLLVQRERGSDIDLNSQGLYAAFKERLSESMWPDAAGMIDGRVAPGLEGWAELGEQPDGHGRYRGMIGYLDAHYPGGYDSWTQDFEALRRNILLGEENSVNIHSTAGLA